MPTTSNFGWTTPADTDLVKDGAAAIRTLGNGIDTSLVDLKGGTTGQYLIKQSNTDLDFAWTTNTADIDGVTATSPLTGGGTSGTITVGIQDATTAQKGAVQLTDSISSTSTTTAATPNSVKTAYDLANGAIAKSLVDAKADLITATADNTPARLAVGNNGETLVADSSATTGLRWQGNFAAGKNKIINGDFSIWQRGTSISGGGFIADRWNNLFDGSGGAFTVSQQTFTPGTAPVAGYEGAFFHRYNCTSARTSQTYALTQQAVEDVRTLAGQTVTLSFWAKADATRNIGLTAAQYFGSGGSANVVALNTNQNFNTSWTRYSYTFSLPSLSGKTIGTGSYIELRFFYPTGTVCTVDIWGVQLEAGNTATAFQTATGTLAGELAACQRYYHLLTSGKGTGSGNYIGAGANYSATQMNTGVTFPVTMRTSPTLSATSGTNYYKFERNGAADQFNSFTIFFPHTNGAMIYNNTEISGTAGQAGTVSTDNDLASIAFSAEL